MPIAQGSRSDVTHKIQSAFGVQATGNYTKLPYRTHSLRLDKGTVEDPTIRGDREVSDYRHTTRSASGDIEVSFRDGDYENLLASLMFNPWLTDTIGIGTTPQYLSIEDRALDIEVYKLFKDMVVNQARLRFSPGEIVQATFSLVGTAMANPSGSTGSGTPVEPSTNQPFDALNAAIYDTTEESGGELAIATSIDLTVDNGARPIFAIGSQDAVAIEFGRARVSGTMSLYFESATWLQRFRNETEAALVINITDPDSQSMEFRMNRIKVNGGDAAVQNEQSRIITVPFQALKPRTGLVTTALQISRN